MKIKILPKAQQELSDTVDFYEQQLSLINTDILIHTCGNRNLI